MALSIENCLSDSNLSHYALSVPLKGVRYITVKRTSDSAYSVFLNQFPTFVKGPKEIYGYGRISHRNLGSFESPIEAAKAAESEALKQKVSFLSPEKRIVTLVWVEQGYLTYSINGDAAQEVGVVSDDYLASENGANQFAQKQGFLFIPATAENIEISVSIGSV